MLRDQGFRARRLPMTSLIDIIFLLLLFFMFSTSFTRLTEIEISAGGTGEAAAVNELPRFLQLAPEQLLLNGEAVERADLAARLGAGTGPVLVTLKGDVAVQALVDLLAELRLVPGLDVRVLD